MGSAADRSPHDKSIFLCFKVCPLYCSKRRRRDVDLPPLAYGEDWFPTPEYWVEDFHHHLYIPYHHHTHWVYTHKPTITPMPTTPKPTTTMPPTTTAEPTFICVVCENKCGFPPKSRR
ncbi:unnamed protein product [Arctia plantaginis]|uniref:Uncharacterized protein n=1 Tax=Arctia plantaginis TaxID=874455 RepID=A0A8S1APL2_ARCPL|nr:unnamed protein product [Arctia plantaginis]